MTLAPSKRLGLRLTLVEDEDVRVHEELGRSCSVPECWEPPEPGAHHIEPRSRTGGPKKFVVIDGLVVVNRCRLCWRHHLAVTGGVGGHKAKIVWHEEPDPHWCWVERWGGPDWKVVGPLLNPLYTGGCDGGTLA